ncbi:MAG: hypothetical protein KGH72_00245 [Candidatus Micrarchaeota archaeon]|nr:hypothetical protein [Candidatus Micrarchaeota archaeon]
MKSRMAIHGIADNLVFLGAAIIIVAFFMSVPPPATKEFGNNPLVATSCSSVNPLSITTPSNTVIVVNWNSTTGIPIVNGHQAPPPAQPKSALSNTGCVHNFASPASVVSTHYWLGAVDTAPAWARGVSTTIQIPGAAPQADDYYYVLMSAWDNAGSYDQIGFSDFYGQWGLVYSWTSGPPNALTYHYSPIAAVLTPGATYTFQMIAPNNGQVQFLAYEGSALVWSYTAPTGGGFLYLNYSDYGYYDYTDYEEVYSISEASLAPPYGFYFYNNAWTPYTTSSPSYVYGNWYPSEAWQAFGSGQPPGPYTSVGGAVVYIVNPATSTSVISTTSFPTSVPTSVSTSMRTTSSTTTSCFYCYTSSIYTTSVYTSASSSVYSSSIYSTIPTTTISSGGGSTTTRNCYGTTSQCGSSTSVATSVYTTNPSTIYTTTRFTTVATTAPTTGTTTVPPNEQTYTASSCSAKGTTSAACSVPSGQSGTFCWAGSGNGALNTPFWSIDESSNGGSYTDVSETARPFASKGASACSVSGAADTVVAGLAVQSSSGQVQYTGESGGNASKVLSYTYTYTTDSGSGSEAVALMISCGWYGCPRVILPQGCSMVSSNTGSDNYENTYLALCNQAEGSSYYVTVYLSGPGGVTVSDARFANGVWSASSIQSTTSSPSTASTSVFTTSPSTTVPATSQTTSMATTSPTTTAQQTGSYAILVPHFCYSNPSSATSASCSVSASGYPGTFCWGSTNGYSINSQWPVMDSVSSSGYTVSEASAPFGSQSCNMTEASLGAMSVAGFALTSSGTINYEGQVGATSGSSGPYNFTYNTNYGPDPEAVALMVACGRSACQSITWPSGCNVAFSTPAGYGDNVALALCNQTESHYYSVIANSNTGGITISAAKFANGVWS